MSTKSATTGTASEWAVTVVDTMGEVLTFPVASKAWATRRAKSLAKDGAYSDIRVVGPADPAAPRLALGLALDARAGTHRDATPVNEDGGGRAAASGASP